MLERPAPTAPAETGDPTGREVPGWSRRPEPERIAHQGRYVRLEPLSSAYYAELYAATCGPEDRDRWTYLPAEAPRDLPALWMLMSARIEADPATYVIVPEGGAPAGVFSLCGVDPAHGTIEIGWVLFGGRLQRTRAATEAIHLLQAYCLDELGYRRLEWKCDSRNAPSRRAAERFGFTYEGRFRNHRVVKGHNRDTDWFSITAEEWPPVRAAHERWLDPANFDAEGRQRTALGRGD